MKSLIERNGNIAFIAPSMQEIPLESNEKIVSFAKSLLSGRIEIVIFETGVGAWRMLDVLQVDFGSRLPMGSPRRNQSVGRGNTENNTRRIRRIDVHQRSATCTRSSDSREVGDERRVAGAFQSMHRRFDRPDDEPGVEAGRIERRSGSLA